TPRLTASIIASASNAGPTSTSPATTIAAAARPVTTLTKPAVTAGRSRLSNAPIANSTAIVNNAAAAAERSDVLRQATSPSATATAANPSASTVPIDGRRMCSNAAKNPATAAEITTVVCGWTLPELDQIPTAPAR